MQAEAIFGMSLGLVAIVCLFVILPWMILHYISKARSNRKPHRG
jgi:flagellar biogenesis protein FliO